MTIPVSQIVSVLPGVLTTAGNAIDLNGVVLTQATDVPIGSVAKFATAADVAAYFGPSSTESEIATIYFAGPTNATALPGALYFYQYNGTTVSAYLRSAKLGLTLTQLQALSGTISITVDGVSATSSSISLSAATSFSNAATLIQAGFTSPNFVVSYSAQHDAFVFTSSSSGASSTATFATGTLSAGLKLTSATGAVLSQGAVAATPATAMASLVVLTQNWAAFMTTWEPTLTDKVAFSAWVSGTNDRYAYVGYDSDPNALIPGSTSTWVHAVQAAQDSGTVAIYGDVTHAAFTLSWIASIDFNRLNGANTLAFKSQAGLIASVTNASDAQALLANGYNYYGAYATANSNFVFMYNGSVSGPFAWLDDYCFQIWLNANLQLALMTLLMSQAAVPYNSRGNGLIRSACLDPINAGLNFGGIQTGVTLSSSQIQQLIVAIGQDVSNAISASGYYLFIGTASPATRVARGTPPITLYYTSGGKVQQITMSSVEVA